MSDVEQVMIVPELPIPPVRRNKRGQVKINILFFFFFAVLQR